MLDWVKTKLLEKLLKTEFWVALATPAAGYLATKLGLPPEVLQTALLGLAGVASSYILSRGVAKHGQDASAPAAK